MGNKYLLNVKLLSYLSEKCYQNFLAEYILVVALLAAAVILALPLKAQVTIGVLRKPNATLEVAKLPDGSATPDGIMPPQMTLKQINNERSQYTTAQAGAMVYCTDATDTLTIPGYSDAITCTGQVYWSGDHWVSDCGLIKHYELALTQPKAFSFYETGSEPVTPLVFKAGGYPEPATYQWYKIVGSNINFRVATPCVENVDGTGTTTNFFTPTGVEKGSTIDANNCGFYKYYCEAKNPLGDSIESNLAEVAVGCGAKDMYGDWISFMCFNLGANPQTINQQKSTSITLTPTGDGATYYRSANEKNLYGDLYQWGRIGDGHQNRNSIRQGSNGANTTTDNVVAWNATTPPTYESPTGGYPSYQVSRTDPNGYYGKFIITAAEPNYDWFSGAQTNGDQLWRDIFTPSNDPCAKLNADGSLATNYPTAAPWYGSGGWRIPNQTEWGLIFRGGTIGGAPGTAYANNWNWYRRNSADANEGANGYEIKPDGVTTTLFLPASGSRNNYSAELFNSGVNGLYWSGSITGVNSFILIFTSGSGGTVNPANIRPRGGGFALRCVKQ